MSWNIKTVGKRENVKALIAANQHVPQKVKEAIFETIDAGDKIKRGTDGNHDGVRVEGFGHHDAQHAWSSIGKLEVEPVALAPETSAE